MSRTWTVILLGAMLGFAAIGCDTAAPAPYYSSRRDLLGQPAPGGTPPNTIDQRLSGSPAASTNAASTAVTNSPPRQSP
ncbi:MAG TPA: hypothetical protein VMP11_10290 [Verrucomicrobiae bacterium]|nr:hypothetical protein [Verrucomicrobiae bacterium]